MEDNREAPAGTVSELEEENRRLRQENERLKSLSAKERLYDRVHVSVKTMDRIIAGLCILFVIVVVLGMLAGK